MKQKRDDSIDGGIDQIENGIAQVRYLITPDNWKDGCAPESLSAEQRERLLGFIEQLKGLLS